MQVLFYDIVTKLPLGNARQLPTLDELLERPTSSPCTCRNTGDQNMIGAQQMAHMKQGSLLINASRGTVVDIDALAAALECGHLGGAAIDVFPVEPQANDERSIAAPRCDNVILTPHIGGSTAEAQANIGREVAEKLIRYSDNGSTAVGGELPGGGAAGAPGRRRCCTSTATCPGVMSRSTSLRAGINIDAQFLRTNEKVGYVVIDVDGSAQRRRDGRDVLDTGDDPLPGAVLSRPSRWPAYCSRLVSRQSYSMTRPPSQVTGNIPTTPNPLFDKNKCSRSSGAFLRRALISDTSDWIAQTCSSLLPNPLNASVS